MSAVRVATASTVGADAATAMPVVSAAGTKAGVSMMVDWWMDSATRSECEGVLYRSTMSTMTTTETGGKGGKGEECTREWSSAAKREVR